MKKNLKKIFLVIPILLSLVTSSTKASVVGWEKGLDLANDVTLPGQGDMIGPVFLLISLFLWLLKVFIILSIISFVVAGIIFFFSVANAKLREKAKEIVTYSIIGIAVGFSGVIILSTILALLYGGGFVSYLF